MPSPLDAALPASAEIEALLTASFGARTTIERVEPLHHPWVLRAHLAETTGLPDTVVVKCRRPEGYGLRSAEELTRCEHAALAFIADDLRLDLAPCLHAASPDSRLLVLEDLYPRTELAALLHRDGHTAALDAELTAFASSMGELAATSVGRATLFNARRTALGTGADRLGDWEHAYAGLWRNGLARAAAFGVPLPAAAERDLETAVAELADPGPFLALTNGDPESHNYLTGPSGGGKLIDFEGAGFRHALTAATSFTVPGPDWLGVSGPEQVEAFRRALARTVPEAEDDQRFGFGLASASMVWVMTRTGRLKTLDARSPGDDSRTQMVALLESGARTAEAHRVLPHLAAWCRSTATLLRRRWPDTDIDTAAPYTWRERQGREPGGHRRSGTEDAHARPRTDPDCPGHCEILRDTTQPEQPPSGGVPAADDAVARLAVDKICLPPQVSTQCAATAVGFASVQPVADRLSLLPVVKQAGMP